MNQAVKFQIFSKNRSEARQQLKRELTQSVAQQPESTRADPQVDEPSGGSGGGA